MILRTNLANSNERRPEEARAAIFSRIATFNEAAENLHSAIKWSNPALFIVEAPATLPPAFTSAQIPKEDVQSANNPAVNYEPTPTISLEQEQRIADARQATSAAHQPALTGNSI